MLPDLLTHLGPCDLVLVEGFKHGSHHKIEVVRRGTTRCLLADSDPTICAVATDDLALAGRHRCLPLNDAAAIADFVCETVGLNAG